MKKETKQQSLQSATNSLARQNVADNATENACPQCNHTNDEGAVYCAECAAALQEPQKCPQCGATAHLNADICEECGTWLLKGQCMFCYAHVEDDENYCGECGNPANGITCPRCGKPSIFDFCSACGIPLSIQAKEMVLEATQDPEFQEIASLFEQAFNGEASPAAHKTDRESITAATVTIKQLQDDQLSQLKSYRDLVDNQSQRIKKTVSKALFSNDQTMRINRLNEEVAQEEERQRQEEERRRKEVEERCRQEEERRRQAEKQLNKAMRTLSGKTFSSNQEARRFFMNMIAGLTEEVALKVTNKGLKWRCNCCDVIHDSPSQCGDPSLGGVWLIE